MSTTMTTTLGTSNVRGSSRQTRTNPTRVSKTIGATLRQNSLISNPPAPGQGAAEPPAFYPAITYFADAIAALPRDYRRHTSLLKEVDAKAWSSEESLQTLLTQCLIETNTPRNVDATGHGAAATATVAMDDGVDVSAANSVAGAPADTASQSSNRSADPAMVQRRQLFATLRHNLMQMMVTMEEKNHVINNANEELSRGMRRLDSVWPHIAGEISEEARLGSLKHWAYTETNPVKKPTAPTTRREATSTTAVLHENEVAHRSESRREAVLAKKHRSTQNVDSDFDDLRTAAARKAAANGKKRGAEAAADPAGLGISGVGSGKRKKIEKAGPAAATVGMERSLSAALAASSRMSREPSQQDNGSKKRKAPNASSTVARKRINGNPQDSPKLASSPLAGNFGKEAYKRSPALSTVRPVAGRARQNSTQTLDGGRGRPSSSTSHRNGTGNGGAGHAAELNPVVAVTGKTANEVKNTVKEANNKADLPIEDDDPPGSGSGSGTNSGGGDAGVRAGPPIERTTSKQGTTKSETNTGDETSARAIASPRLPPALLIGELRGDRPGRGRASKTSTPVVGTFSESEAAELSAGNGGTKSKRPARPRAKDHGLHDSLSPKGLPLKRSHKKGAGLVTQQQATQRLKDEVEGTTSNGVDDTGHDEDDDEAENGGDDDERYCYCDGVSYGEMVACDNKDCPREWFHLDCIGLKSVPKSAKWYCDECKENLAKRGKFNNGGGNGGGGSTGGNGK